MTKNRSQELSERAAAERRRCRDWLIPFMQNGQPKFLTKDEPLPYPQTRYRGAVSGNDLWVSAVSSDVAYWGKAENMCSI
jgi:hypothetical protein